MRFAQTLPRAFEASPSLLTGTFHIGEARATSSEHPDRPASYGFHWVTANRAARLCQGIRVNVLSTQLDVGVHQVSKAEIALAVRLAGGSVSRSGLKLVQAELCEGTTRARPRLLRVALGRYTMQGGEALTQIDRGRTFGSWVSARPNGYVNEIDSGPFAASPGFRAAT